MLKNTNNSNIEHWHKVEISLSYVHNEKTMNKIKEKKITI